MSHEPEVALLLHLNNRGGSIVSSNDLTPMEIAAARAGGRMVVSPGGFGFVWVPKPDPVAPTPAPIGDAARLAAAFRSLADALEGRGSKPLPCSDGNIPAVRLSGMLVDMTCEDDDARDAALTFAQVVLDVAIGLDAVEVLAAYGLLDE